MLFVVVKIFYFFGLRMKTFSAFIAALISATVFGRHIVCLEFWPSPGPTPSRSLHQLPFRRQVFVHPRTAVFFISYAGQAPLLPLRLSETSSVLREWFLICECWIYQRSDQVATSSVECPPAGPQCVNQRFPSQLTKVCACIPSF